MLYHSLPALQLMRVIPLRRLNKCGVISPRFDVRHGQIEDWVAKLLPSRLVSPSALPLWKGNARTRD